MKNFLKNTKQLFSLKKLLFLFLIFFLNFFVFAGDSWTLIPEGSGANGTEEAIKQVKDVGKESGKVWEQYNKYAEKNSSQDAVGTAFASGIFSWDSIFYFLKHIVKVLSELGLVIGALMIIYAGYKYATGVFTGDASKGGKDAIKGAIYGVLIVIFSYAIMRILLSMFW